MYDLIYVVQGKNHCETGLLDFSECLTLEVLFPYIYGTQFGHHCLPCPVEVLEPDLAMPSAGTVLSEKFDIFSAVGIQRFHDTLTNWWHHPKWLWKSCKILWLWNVGIFASAISASSGNFQQLTTKQFQEQYSVNWLTASKKSPMGVYRATGPNWNPASGTGIYGLSFGLTHQGLMLRNMCITEAKWCTYASANKIINGFNNARVPTALEKSLKFRSVSRSWKNHWISWKALEICRNEKIIEFWLSHSWKNHWILK